MNTAPTATDTPSLHLTTLAYDLDDESAAIDYLMTAYIPQYTNNQRFATSCSPL